MLTESMNDPGTKEKLLKHQCTISGVIRFSCL
jgi:hypothetical protein